MEEFSYPQKLLAEVFGTAMLVFVGVGSVPATLIVGGQAPFTMAELGMISFAFAMIVVAMIYAIGHISGCQINPAVTVALAVTKKMPWRDVPGYIAAQVVGAILGAWAIIGVLGHAAADVGLGVAAYGANVGAGQAFFAEAVGTFILVFVVFGAIHAKAPGGFAGLAIGMAVFAAIVPVAPATGASINPARTIGPMLILQFAGGDVHWDQLPVYWLAEFAGAILAGLLYVALSTARKAQQMPKQASTERVAEGARVVKKFINEPADVVKEALAGVAAAHDDLRVDFDNQFVARADAPVRGKVALVSGGGSGHEPLHGGFVGPGMLDAACPGEVFTSPVPDQILAATKAVDAGAGVVHIVKNYTGDVLNFQMAAELAGDDGTTVETVLVDDDVAVEDSTWTAGRRGTGATLIVEKVAGARAEEGGSLAEVAAVGRKVNTNSGSFAVALTACTTPAAGRPGFDLPDDEIEIGVGIHGEPGRERRKLLPAKQIVALAVEAILAAKPLSDGERAIVIVNGLGGTPLLELYLIFGEVAAQLKDRGVTIARNLVGNFVTSLDMAGMSVTVCRADDELLRLWDAPVRTAALRWGR